MQNRFWLICLMMFTTSLAGAAVPKKRGSDYDEGKKIWKRSCWQCHGIKAEGDGPAAEAVAGGVPSLRGGVVVKAKRNELIRLVLGGKGLMPAFAEEMERPDAKRVLIYLEKLDARNGVEPEEEEEEEEEDAENDPTEEEDAAAEDAPTEEDAPESDLEAPMNPGAPTTPTPTTPPPVLPLEAP